jgi:diguanylate cyclase (GGDEF)-like protein
VSDSLSWQENAAAVLGVASLSEIGTGAGLEARIAPEHRASWRSAIRRGSTDANRPAGVSYRVQFRLLPDARPNVAPTWIEDSGRWWATPDGRPIRSRGILRVIDDRYLEDLRLGFAPGDDLLAERNRVRLLEALGAVIGRAERGSIPSTLYMIAIKALDAVNARLGYDIGDEIIASAGRLLRSELGAEDWIGRYASNTFAVIVSGTGAPDMQAGAERLMARVHDAVLQTSAGPLSASIAVGGVALPEHTHSGADAIAHALAALGLAKTQPVGAFAAHRPDSVAERARKREQAVANSVLAALEDNRMLLLLQPIVEASSGKPVLYEALLRLRRTDGSLVPAGDFVEEAEKLGLARLIDRRALELAIALMIAHPRLALTLNVSSLTAGDRDWLAALRTLTAGDAGLTRRLVVEITETAMIHDLDEVVAFVADLRTLGCRIAIDDFGAGYTSFRHLRTLRVDMLKIDGMFVKDLPTGHHARAMIAGMIEIARSLGLEAVAEWVTTEEDAAFLRAAGATYLQGYLFGAPMPVEELVQKGLL